MDKIRCVIFRGNGGESCGSVANSLKGNQATKELTGRNTIFNNTNKTISPLLSQPMCDIFENGASKCIRNYAR